jgi:hypothetical protein
MRHLKLVAAIAMLMVTFVVVPGYPADHPAAQPSTASSPSGQNSGAQSSDSEKAQSNCVGETLHCGWTVIAYPFRVVNYYIGYII